jgi:hypothetical protein
LSFHTDYKAFLRQRFQSVDKRPKVYRMLRNRLEAGDAEEHRVDVLSPKDVGGMDEREKPGQVAG